MFTKSFRLAAFAQLRHIISKFIHKQLARMPFENSD